MRRLLTALRRNREKLKTYREFQVRAVKQITGSHAVPGGSAKAVPFNVLEMGTSVYTRNLVAQCPRTSISTQFRELKAAALTLELALNHLLEEIKIEQTLRDSVYDAMLCMSIVQVGMAPYGTLDDPEQQGTLLDVGQPFAKRVDLDAWVHDMTAPSYEECAFSGYHSRMRYDYVMESDLFKHKDGLLPTSRNEREEGEEQDKIRDISRGKSEWDDDDLYEMIDLWHVWLPQERLFVTFPYGQEREQCLREVEWEGPEAGPFHLLGFMSIPGQIMPLAPVSLWIDMHETINGLFRKLSRQAERQKTMGVYEGGAEDDASAIVKGNDGQMIRVNDIDKIKEISQGGVDPNSLALLLQVVNQFSWYSGNLDLLAGLSPQSDTLGQDRLLAANASKRMEDMSSQVYRFTRDITQDLGEYLWYDPLIEMPLTKRIEELKMDVRTEFSPELREGDFVQYNIKIEPYSLQWQSPQSKSKTIMEMAVNLLIPMAPTLAEQGIFVDIGGLVRSLAKLNNLEAELADVVQYAEPSETERRGPVKPPMPTQSKRTYERVNRPGGTRQGQDNAMMQTLLGAGVQDAQAGSIGRRG